LKARARFEALKLALYKFTRPRSEGRLQPGDGSDPGAAGQKLSVRSPSPSVYENSSQDSVVSDKTTACVKQKAKP
jgi:hypothetical protein